MSGDHSKAMAERDGTASSTIPLHARWPTQYWQRLPDGRIRCDACPRGCSLQEGQRGLCFVRARADDQIVLTTYGRSSGFCIDPIEKKPLNHYLPGTPILSFGTAGCNLQCKFCQNWSISKSREWDMLANRADPETVAKAAEQLGCRSVAFTYNDPVIFLEYAIDIAQACHERNIAAVAVTAGYIEGKPREDFFRHMDAANVDLKAFTDQFYRDITKSELSVVKDTLLFLRDQGKTWFEITTLLIPGENDSHEEIRTASRWIAKHLGLDVPLHFSAFHPDYRMLDKPHTPPQTLSRARAIAMGEGLRYVYVGNVVDPQREATWCPGCGDAVIRRNRYELSLWQLDEAGRCLRCQMPIPGRFEATPGAWGSRRVPVRLE